LDRITRKELKSDKFAQEVGHTVHYLEEHRQQVIRYGSIAAGLIVVAFVAWYVIRSQSEQRQRDLAEAFRVANAAVTDSVSDTVLSFKTQAEKDAAVQKQFNEIISKHSGSDQAAIANYMLGVAAADKGKLEEAQKYLKTAADSGKHEYAALAKFSLAEVYASQGKTAEAEKLLRELLNNPATLVSKDQVTIALATAIAKSKPDEAKKLLEPLRTQSGAASRVAIARYGELFEGK